jgi:hypothetical protein
MTMRGFADLLVARFKECLEAYDRDCPFTKYGQLEYHAETIERRRNLGSAQAALDDQSFQRSLYKTLKAWGIGSRGSILKPFPAFVDALGARSAEIRELDGFTIDQRELDIPRVGARLARLIQALEIVDNKARVVPGSKALHHILPDLVVPIDREYTQRFFKWPNARLQEHPEKCFAEAFGAFVKIARVTNPVQYVGKGWYSSRTKVIDNAIVGLWCLASAQLKREDGLLTTGYSGPPSKRGDVSGRGMIRGGR